MAAFKNKDNGTWYVQFRYTDWKGERQQIRTRTTAPGMCSSATPTGRVSASRNSSVVLPPNEKRWNGNGSS